MEYFNELFTHVATEVREKHEGTKVMGENTRMPSQFPLVALDETRNVSLEKYEDSSLLEKYTGITLKLQVFSNKETGKKAECRAIFQTADTVLRHYGLSRKTYTTTPDIYNSTIYQITATYEGVISSDGVIYRK